MNLSLNDIIFDTQPDNTSPSFIKSVKQFLTDDDFLAFTLRHPKSIPYSFTFYLEVSGDETDDRKKPTQIATADSHSATTYKITIPTTGIIILEPKSSEINQHHIISSGVHGNETAPIEICNGLISQILSQKWVLRQRVMFIFGNPPAISEGKRFIDKNLNTLFSTTHLIDNTFDKSVLPYEKKRSQVIELAIKSFFSQCGSRRYHLDLHTSIRESHYEKFAILPYIHNQKYHKELLVWLNSFGVNTLLLASGPTNALGYFSSVNFNAHAVTIELGKVRPFGENNLADFTQLINHLIYLLSGNELSVKEYASENFIVFKTSQVINRTHHEFSFNFSHNVPNFTFFKQSSLLATDGDIKYHVKEPEEAVVFPNVNVELNQRALLTVVRTKISV